MKIISGGQTGIDRMGLIVATELGIDTGGTAPKYFMTEYGPDLSLKNYGLTECQTAGYPARTERNIIDSDMTVIYGDPNETGSNLTIELCRKHSKPCLINPAVRTLASYMISMHTQILNVAGNRMSKLKPKTYESAKSLLIESLKIYINHLKDKVCTQ